MCEKGKKYRVVSDDCNSLNRGDIVVALEDGCVPFCVLESVYDEAEEPQELIKKCQPICWTELEEIEEG